MQSSSSASRALARAGIASLVLVAACAPLGLAPAALSSGDLGTPRQRGDRTLLRAASDLVVLDASGARIVAGWEDPGVEGEPRAWCASANGAFVALEVAEATWQRFDVEERREVGAPLLARGDSAPRLANDGRMALVSGANALEIVGLDGEVTQLATIGDDATASLFLAEERGELLVSEHSTDGRHRRTRAFSLDGSENGGAGRRVLGAQPERLQAVGALGQRLWLLASSPSSGEVIEVDLDTGARRTLVPGSGHRIEAVTLIGPHLAVRYAPTTAERFRLFTTSGSFARRIMLPESAAVDGLDGSLARSFAFFSMETESEGRELHRYDARTGESEPWTPGSSR